MVTAEAQTLDLPCAPDSLNPGGSPCHFFHSLQLAFACARHRYPGNPAHSGKWVEKRSPPHLRKQGTGGAQGPKNPGISQAPRSPGPPAGSLLTESKENLVLLPLQVELVHPEQRLKLFPADIVQDFLGGGTQRLKVCLLSRAGVTALLVPSLPQPQAGPLLEPGYPCPGGS